MNRPISILDRWGITVDDLTDLVDQNPSLRGMLLGYVAEKKFHDTYLSHADISDAIKDDDHDRKLKGDRRVVYRGHRFIIEVKSLQTKTVRQMGDGVWTGKAQVDGSDRRVIRFPDKTTLDTTLLLRGEFDLLAVNCFAFDGTWRFLFAKNSDLPSSTFSKYTEVQRSRLIASLVQVTWPPTPPFTDDPYILLDELIAEKSRS